MPGVADPVGGPRRTILTGRASAGHAVADARERRGIVVSMGGAKAGVRVWMVCAAMLAVSCSSEARLPAAEGSEPAADVEGGTTPITAGADDATTTPTPIQPRDVAVDVAADGGIVVDTSVDLGVFDRRLLGTNVEAWLGAERFEREEFQATLARAGVTVIRMPGGSWSNHYDWLACERGSEQEGCFWTWAARPSDFVGLLQRTGLEGMWTVSINETAQHSAALVAFFNGDVDDPTVIGVDRDGVDWGTVGQWARLRVEGGHDEPVGLRLWEVGNEVYGAKAEFAGEGCADFGWEEVWTCEGDEYVTGTSDHDGYLDIRAAMLAVDPSISVGAVGVPVATQWGNWGNEVIGAAAEDLDFYIVHQYGFDESRGVADIVDRPGEIWPSTLASLHDDLPVGVPIAVTEHNLVSGFTRDGEATMIQGANALFLADTIGQMAIGGVQMANHWDFASGTTDNGTNYGLVDADALSPFPTFFAMVLWSRFGDVLHPVGVAPELAADVGVYAATDAGGGATVIVINRSGSEIATSIRVGGDPTPRSVIVDQLVADHPTDTTVIFNGVIGDSTSVTDTAGAEVVVEDGSAPVVLPAWSVTLVRSSDGS